MERAGMQEYFGEVRAYFAPVNRTTETGTVFDPSAAFDVDNPPARLGAAWAWCATSSAWPSPLWGRCGPARREWRKCSFASWWMRG